MCLYSLEGRKYPLEEVNAMLRVLPEPAATVVATAAFSGLRAGELRGLEWPEYVSAENEDSLGLLYVRRSVWRSTVGDPKTQRSKAPVPVIPQLAERINAYRAACGNPGNGPIFANGNNRPLDLNWLAHDHILPLLDKCLNCGHTRSEHGRDCDHVFRLDRQNRIWHGWHGFRRGLASNLNRLGVDDSVIQAILRHSTVQVTQNCYINTARPDVIGAMRRFSQSFQLSVAPKPAPEAGNGGSDANCSQNLFSNRKPGARTILQ